MHVQETRQGWWKYTFRAVLLCGKTPSRQAAVTEYEIICEGDNVATNGSRTGSVTVKRSYN